MSKTYSPLGSLTTLRRAMQDEIAKHEHVIPGSQVAPPLAVTERAAPCCILLQTLVEGGPVPDDLIGITTGAQLKAHVRPDGAVYQGAYEVMGQPDSVVIVYADQSLKPGAAEHLANMERPALVARHAQ